MGTDDRFIAEGQFKVKLTKELVSLGKDNYSKVIWFCYNKSMLAREYNTIHQWNLRNWVKTGVCELCNTKTKTQWSNISGKYIRFDKADWQELCAKCHHWFDVKYQNKNLGRSSGRPKIINYHGTMTGYTHRSCRCTKCKQVWHEYYISKKST